MGVIKYSAPPQTPKPEPRRALPSRPAPNTLAASSPGVGPAISRTEAVAGLASVVKPEGARLLVVGERRRVLGELVVALLVEEGDVEVSSPPARFVDEGEVVRGEVGEDERAVVGHITVRSDSAAEI